ncbi:MAG TPA: hypothetical protein QGF35_00490, partial [Dehalococcoidia bacterium]|nr:hypothetical protein [Dehalococcoidia bacterium]
MSKQIAHKLSGKRFGWLIGALVSVAMLGTLGANWLADDANARTGSGSLSVTTKIQHWDIDAGTENAAGNTNGILSVFHDPDDARGSLHRVCITGGDLVSGDNASITYSVHLTAGSASENNGAKIAGPGSTPEPCYEWASANVGSQTINATYGAETIYFDGVPLTTPPGDQPLVKEWNVIDSTKLVAVTGILGPGLGTTPTTIAANTGELDNWIAAPATATPTAPRECVRDDGASATDVNCVDRADVNGSTIEVSGLLMTTGTRAGYIYTKTVKSFIDYTLGSHSNYTGPIDGASQTYTAIGTCGTVRVENPVTGNTFVLTPGGAAVTVLSSDKGVGISIYATDDGIVAANALDPDLNCQPNQLTGVSIVTTEAIQLRSDIDLVPAETVVIKWVAPPAVTKQPILAWAGQRIVLEHDWTIDGTSCPWDEEYGRSNFAVLYLKQAQGPGSFSADVGGNNILYVSPDAALAEVDIAVETDNPNSGCISRVMYESQDQGEVDISAYIVEGTGGQSPTFGDLASAQPRSQEVD